MKLNSIEETKDVQDALCKALDEINRIILGRDELNKLVLAGILARGHILLEGLPGLGKTALIKIIGEILQLDFKRIQFTPDLMPGDIVGSHILQTNGDGKNEIAFQPGPVFCNILLADEVNRASPKTQAALLETMQERSVTLLGQTRQLPNPFFVLASQNPIELEGTYPLPEAQLDRFLFKLCIDGSDAATMTSIIATRKHGNTPKAQYHMSAEMLTRCMDAAENVVLPYAVANWIARIVEATHPSAASAPEKVRKFVRYGASPRAAIAMADAAKAMALLDGRPTAGFEDVRAVACAVLNHRLLLSYQAKIDGVAVIEVIDEVLDSIDEANMQLPNDIEVK